jgi:hypothetical protein
LLLEKRTSRKWQAYLVVEDDPGDTFRIPKELIDIIIANDSVMILLPPDELAFNNFIPLVSDKPIKRFHHRPQVKTFWHRFDPILAFGTPIIVIRAFEYETQALGDEPDLSGLSPT